MPNLLALFCLFSRWQPFLGCSPPNLTVRHGIVDSCHLLCYHRAVRQHYCERSNREQLEECFESQPHPLAPGAG